MLGKRKLETEGPDKDDNFEDDSPVDMEIVRERMKLVPIPEGTFREMPSDIFDDQAVLKYNDGVEGIKSLKIKTEGPLLDSKNCMNANSGLKGSPFLEADKCNRNEAELSIPYNESAELVPTHHTMSDICPPNFSIWTAEDDLVLKNAVEAGAALEALAKGAVRFSRRFTVRELRERWHALLYNPEISTKAAASMVEVELSHMSFSKLAQSSKLNGKDDIAQKHKLQNVRNQYYQMRKRIDAERIPPVQDYSLFPNDAVVICTGNANEVVQEERAVMYEGGPLAVSIEEAAVAPPFGLSDECLDIEDKAFNQMVNFLASGGLEGDAGAFSSTNMDSLEVNPAPLNLISNGCFDFSRHDPSVMPTVTATDSVNLYISTENMHHLVEDMPQEEVHNSVNIHDRSYIIQSSLPLDTITAPIINNEPNMNPVSLVNCNSGTFQSIDTRYNRAAGFEKAVSEENIAASGMLSQASIGNWEGDPAFLMPSMTVDIKDNADETIISTEYEGTSGPRESVGDGHVMLSSLATKEKLLISSSGLVQSSCGKVQHEPQQQPAPNFLPNCSEGSNMYALRNGQELLCNSEYVMLGTPMKDESQVGPSQSAGNMAPCSNNSAMEMTVCLESNGLEVASIPAFTSPVNAQAGQEWSHDAVKSEDLTLNIYANCQPHLFVHGPMDCVLNTEDTNVPDNDEFNPLAYQEPSSISSVIPSSYVEQTTAWGSLSMHGNLGNSMPLCKGYPVVKEEPETVETLVQAANELQPLSFKDKESNMPSSDYQQVKMEILEFTAPSVVSEEVGASKNESHPGVPSSSLPVALQQGISTVPLMLENSTNNKFKLLSSDKCIHAPLHGNDGYVDFARPLQFEGAPAIQDNIMQVSQVASFIPIDDGLNDFQVMSCEEAAADQFPENQENNFSDSDEELPHFSDVEAMYSSTCLLFLNWHAGYRYWIWTWILVMMNLFLQGLVTIGRVTQDNLVDIDLGKEGRANKVSRRQATIRLREDGLFYLENHGRRAIAVNSCDIMSGQCIRLGSNCLIEIGGMTFIFEISRRRREQSDKKHQARMHT
ncbi:uncharacterized protein LOC131028707 isoform X2 [Cryptomeria japonica]|uniref:uncharacterized protein LOC131028707 isoform X2 n=1 Tax=Cryptomeria japonica TaxID=3369 RepID=UPI0027DA1707|nr:uncharacterized protein LOC131028707 isoform X2 [Cryptomeria japonica]